MANRYWVGGTATWDGTAGTKWATTSGGAGGAAVPTAADDVFLDASSGANTVTLSSSSVCRSINCTGFTGTISHPASTTFSIGDATAGASSVALLFVSGMTYTLGNNSSSKISFISTSSTVQTVTSGGKTFGNLIFNGAGGSWSLADNLNVNADSINSIITLTQGTLNTNGKTVTTAGISSSNSNTRTLTLGASTITTSGFTPIDFTTSTNLTFNAGTSLIQNNLNGNPLSFNGGGKTFYNVTFLAGGAYISGTNTFNNLSATPTTFSTSLTLEANQTVSGTFTATGVNATTRVFVNSDILGTSRTITAAAVSITNVDFSDITGAGAGTWSGTSIGNALNNSGITFTTPVTRYWVGGTGSWSSTTKWSTSTGGASGASVPLVHDTAVFDANSVTTTAQTITLDTTLLKPTIDLTNVAHSPTLSLSTTLYTYGSFIIPSSVTFSGSQSIYFYGRGSYSLTTNGVSLGANAVRLYMFGGTLTLGSNLTTTSNIYLNNGTFSANNFNVTAATLGAFSNTTCTLNMGSGTWTLTGTGTVWQVNDASFTLNSNTSTIIVSDTTATSKTFAGFNRTYYNLTVSGDNVQIQDSNTFNTLAVNTAGLTNGLLLTSGTTQTVSNLTTNGSTGSLAKLSSNSAGSAATLSQARGFVSVDYMSIKDSTATGGASWYAGAHSTNVSGNTGWTFGVPATQWFTDPLSGASIDSTKWTTWGSPTATESSGSLNITTTASSAGAYAGVDSKTPYNLTGSYTSVQVVDAGSVSIPSLDRGLKLSLDANNCVAFVIFGTGAGSLIAKKLVAGVWTNIGSTGTYNSSTMKYIRIRESAGTTYWDYSADGITWTNFQSVANPIAVTSLTIDLFAGTDNSEASTTTVKFANLNTYTFTKTQSIVSNIVKPAISTLKDTFGGASIDSSLWTAYGPPTPTESGGSLNVSTTLASNYAGVSSNINYNLTGSAISVQLVDAGSTSIPSLVRGLKVILDGSNAMDIIVAGSNTLQAKKLVAGTWTVIGSSGTYNSSTMKYFRIRESAGNTYFDYSADAITWTNFQTTTNPFAVTSLQANLQAGTDNTETSTTTVKFANLNYYTFTKTQSVLASIINVKTATQSVIASIRGTRTKTQSLISRISEIFTKTQLIVSRVANTVVRGQLLIANLRSTVFKTQTFKARLQSVNTKTQTSTANIYELDVASVLQDDFTGTTVDTNKWTTSTSSTTLAQNNFVTFTLPTATAGSNYASFSSRLTYTLENSSFSIELVSPQNSATHAQAYLQAYLNSTNKLIITLENGVLYFQKVVAGVSTNITSVTYDFNAHRYWKISDVFGTVYYMTSADGVVWTTQTSVADPFSLTSVYLQFGAGTYQSETNPGTVVFDNFNIVPVTPIKKSYTYKVYSSGAYLGSLPNVISDFSYSQDINTAGSQTTVTVGMSADTSNQSFTQHILTENGNFIDTENGARLITEGASQLIGLGGSGTLIANGNNVLIYEYSSYNPNGKLVFSGQIQRWEASFGGDSGEEAINILIYSDGYDLDNYILMGNPYTSDVSQTTQNTGTSIFDNGSSNYNYFGQTWTTGNTVTNLGAIDLYLNGTANVTMAIYSSVPTNPTSGSPLATTTVSVNTGGVAAAVKFAFSSPVAVSSNTSYFFAITCDVNQSINVYYQSTNPYAGGTKYTATSGVSSGNWVSETGNDLYFKTYYSSGSTTAIFSSVDPTTGMLESFMNTYKAQGGNISYNSSTIDATGLSLSYTFNTSTVYEGIQKVRELAPDGFYYYVDVGADLLYMKQSSTSPDIYLTKGRHLTALTVIATIEQIKNLVYFSGGLVSGSNLFKLYKDNTSITSFGQRVDRLSDNRVTLTATADALGNSDITENSSEEYQTTLAISDTTMDISTLRPGMIVGFHGFGTFIDNLQAQIVRVDYSPEIATLTLGILPKRLIPAFEKITRGLIAEQTVDNPSAPS